MLLALAGMLGGAGLSGVPSASSAPAQAPKAVAASAALSGSDFDPGYIISDSLFYDGAAMTQADIQTFLDQKIGTCTNGNCLNVLRLNTFSRAADRTVCAAYTGGPNERVSAVIFKVQQACGISARVLLVTLQKEQSLVTSTAPNAVQLKIAMGYGCPDTAPCDAEYYGLYNQIYNAAWQLKRYSTPSAWGYYQPGWRQIAYNTDSSCGSLSVNIRNNATAALYNYTPYTPNAAALGSLYSPTPPCGSYGNRNFWVFYNSWFGPSNADLGQPFVDARYAAEGGSAGWLGAAGASTCGSRSTACAQTFAGGVIYWERRSGAWAITPAYDAVFRSAGGQNGAMGSPTSAYITVSGNPNGDGGGQQFQNGTIYSSAAGAFAVSTSLRAEYWKRGSNSGALGWPTSAASCVGGDCAQSFQFGVLFASAASVRVVSGDYLPVYLARSSELGWATSGYINVPANSNGAGGGQQFAKGTIYSSAAGAFAVWGVIRAEYWRAGSNSGQLGWPTADAVCANGLCVQQFQGGVVTQTSANSASSSIAVYPAYLAAYQAHVAELGVATSGYIDVATNPNGAGGGQQFAKGTIYSSAAGAFAVWGPVRAEYWRAGSNSGSLGWPVADAVCANNLCSQQFQGGTVVQTSSKSAQVALPVHPAYLTVYQANSADLGVAISAYIDVAVNPNGVGGGQQFGAGSIYSSVAGVFAVWGDVRAQYWRAGSNSGRLGWPIAAAICASGSCTQQFQGGSLTGAR